MVEQIYNITTVTTKVYFKYLFDQNGRQIYSGIKGQVQCFIMPAVMNMCFLLNPEKNLAKIRLAVFEKNAETT